VDSGVDCDVVSDSGFGFESAKGKVKSTTRGGVVVVVAEVLVNVVVVAVVVVDELLGSLWSVAKAILLPLNERTAEFVWSNRKPKAESGKSEVRALRG